MAELNGCDLLVFTAGISENGVDFRKDVCNRLTNLGVVIDEEVNNFRGEFRVISKPESKVKVVVIPTNEELVIARDTTKLLGL